MNQNFHIPQVIYLYTEGIKNLNFKSLQTFAQKNFSKIPLHLFKLKEKVIQTQGIIFDFLNTCLAFEKLKTAKDTSTCQIILTDRLFATYDERNQLHLRAAIFGFPSVISTSGIVEGPAKPREFYLYKQKYSQLGIWEIEEAKLKKKFKGRFIDYQDRRMTGVLKGYIAQGVFFYLTGEPFCKNKNCRLFNAHWQKDLIYSQIKSGKFCNRHKEILNKIKKSFKDNYTASK